MYACRQDPAAFLVCSRPQRLNYLPRRSTKTAASIFPGLSLNHRYPCTPFFAVKLCSLHHVPDSFTGGLMHLLLGCALELHEQQGSSWLTGLRLFEHHFPHPKQGCHTPAPSTSVSVVMVVINNSADVHVCCMAAAVLQSMHAYGKAAIPCQDWLKQQCGCQEQSCLHDHCLTHVACSCPPAQKRKERRVYAYWQSQQEPPDMTRSSPMPPSTALLFEAKHIPR